MTARTYDEYGWCHWHKGTADSLALIGVQGANGSYSLMACARCREKYRLVPAAEVPRDEWVRAMVEGRLPRRPLVICDSCGQPIPPGQEDTRDVDGATGAGATVHLHREGCSPAGEPAKRYPIQATGGAR